MEFARRLLLTLVAMMLVASPARAQDLEDDEGPPRQQNTCGIALAIDNDGTVQVSLSVMVAKPTALPLRELERKLVEALGRPLQNASRYKDKNVLSLSGRAEHVVDAGGWRIDGTLDLAGVAQVLRPLGLTALQITIVNTYTRSRVGRVTPQTF